MKIMTNNNIDMDKYCRRTCQWRQLLCVVALPFMALLTACSSSDDTAEDTGNLVTLETLKAEVDSDVDGVTRVKMGDNDGTANGEDLRTYFENGDRIYASVTFEHDGMQHCYVHSGGGIFNSTNSPLQFSTTKNQHLIAFYRGDYESTGAHRQRLRNGYTFMVPTDQSNEKGTKANPGFEDGEFLYAHHEVDNTILDANGWPTLQFKHKTSRIILRVHLIDDTAVDDDGTVIGTEFKADYVTEAYIGCSASTGAGSSPTVNNNNQSSNQSGSANGLIYTNSVVTLDEDPNSPTYGNMTLNTITTNNGNNNNYRKVLKALRRQKGDKEVWFTVIFPPQSFSASNGFFNVVFKRNNGTAANYLFPLLLGRDCKEGKVYYFDVLIGSHKPNLNI